ncbi:MAG: GNAT family N-acetyltransferase [Patescibacteria group bacterium]|nr:GNAT family N-acetyltransferase [Patescibacteria group bacterium]
MFIPGKIIKTFKTKKGREIIIRYPKWEDLDEFLRYINQLSKEDTFVTFSGEIISKEEEGRVLANWFLAMEMGNKVVLGCFDKEKLIGLANVDRDLSARTRKKHIGVLGISVEDNYRSQGIGFELAKTIIEEIKNKIKGIKMIVLDVFGPNKKAISLYKKLGFEVYGVLEKGLLYKGKYISDVEIVKYL